VGNILQANFGPTKCNSYACVKDMEKNQVKVVSD